MTFGLLLSDGVDVDPVAVVVVVVVVEVVDGGRDTDLWWKHQMAWKDDNEKFIKFDVTTLHQHLQ